MDWAEETISDLFYGVIAPREDIRQLPAQQEVLLLQDEIRSLAAALPQEAAAQLDTYMEALESARVACCEKAFESGFRIGVKLLLDTMK